MSATRRSSNGYWQERLRQYQRRVGITAVAAGALKPFLKREAEVAPARSRERYRKVSGRNQLVGKVVDLKVVGLMAQVTVGIGEQRVTSIITAEAVREMQLKRGDTVAALVKSTDVMIERM